MGLLVCIAIVMPYAFYYYLWNYPQKWVDLCGRDRDPCRVMKLVTNSLKVVQILSVYSVSTPSWPPPLYFWPLFLFGQFLNIRVYQLLGEAGAHYGVRFGKHIPWVTKFPFGVIKDPQYVGCLLCLVACLHWVPLPYLVLWALAYVFIIIFESKEDPSTRAKPAS